MPPTDARDPFAWPDPDHGGRFHYAGLGGSGMSALAQFQVMGGGRVSGSDRAFDRGERAGLRSRLEQLGITIYPQDGSGVDGDCVAMVVSTAVEEAVPDFAAARGRGVPIIHRSELLAQRVATHRTIAVAGTSGKTTVVAMVFEILRAVDLYPSVISGGELLLLKAQGLYGNAWRDRSDLLVVESDESDGTLVRYEPAIGAILNLHKDHLEITRVAEMFATFRRRARATFVVGEGENLEGLAPGARVFGFGPRATVRGTHVALEGLTSHFQVDGNRFAIPAPGRHNVENALAAIAICQAVGVPTDVMVEPLSRYRGVERRFQRIGNARGVEVIDDFAHNPAKLRAAIETARAIPRGGSGVGGPDTAGAGSTGRVLAVYQPHGFGPTRFLRPDLVGAFAEALGPEDRLWLLEIYYAGGTARRDFSSLDIVSEVTARGTHAEFAPSREWLAHRIAAEAHAGDLVLVMGARDPSLTDLARAILDALVPAGPRQEATSPKGS